MLKKLTGIIGATEEKAVNKLRPLVEDVNDLEPEFERLSDEDLRARTDELRARLEDGESLDDLLPEAFAAVREAAKRTLGQRHFDVQLIGGIALHQGRIAEMKTGEGKTLVATLPAYLNALGGKGVQVVTVNDYLARRDAQWMGGVYDLLGVSVGVLQHETAYLYEASAEDEEGRLERLRPVTRKDAYEADITYGTNNEFGFDYLRDNMVSDLSHRVQRHLSYAIVDEVDNILIDEARTPLIISGPAEKSPNEYYRFARLATGLQDAEDYTIDEKHRTASLTADGMAKLEKLLKVDNLYDPSNSDLVHFAENALKAHAIFLRDREYVVKDGQAVIVDEFTGRLMHGRRYSDGLHQALEAKEELEVQRETTTYATITLQNYFRLYDKLSGMTGTAATEAEEFWKIYKLDVVEIPTNQLMVRADEQDLVYRDQKAKIKAIVNEIEERHKKGQPVLVGTTDIDKSEQLSETLERRGIPHEVLNAKQHEREAVIVAQAGRPGAITVATNMAGRGTDIVLGGNPAGLELSQEEWQADHDRVVEAGGLHIIGTERHEARRIDNQLRGRSGRQGDPGKSRFYIALDDDLMRRFGGERIGAVMDRLGYDDETYIENRVISKSIENAQVKVEAYHFDVRKHLVDYDDVVNTHRDVIYGERDKILGGGDLKGNIESMVERELSDIVAYYLTDKLPDNWDTDSMVKEISGILPPPTEFLSADTLAQMTQEEVEDLLLSHATTIYDALEEQLTPEVMRKLERLLMLRALDADWVQHLTAMENLRQGIGLHAYGQRDPLVMYKKEGHELFEGLQARIQHDIVHSIYHVAVTQADQQQKGSAAPAGSKARKQEATTVMSKVVGNRTREPVPAGDRKVGRNETCPCGSGKKYKRCHGA